MANNVGEDLDLDTLVIGDAGAEAAVASRLDRLDAERSPVVTVRASLTNFDRVRAALCRLRASNVQAILLLRRGEVALDEDEAMEVFSWLRLWDQFLVHNFLVVCGEWIPAEFLPRLEQEGKLELMWFREYSAALADPRLHRYPPLPWRRFLRRLNDENYEFVVSFLELAARPATPDNRELLRAYLASFLEAKKKVVSLFPKRWNRDAGEPS